MSFHQVRQIPRYHALLAACSLRKDGRYLVGIIQCKIRIGRVSCASSVHQAAVVFLILFYTYWNWIYYLAQPRSLFPHLWNVNGISVCKEGFFFFSIWRFQSNLCFALLWFYFNARDYNWQSELFLGFQRVRTENNWKSLWFESLLF